MSPLEQMQQIDRRVKTALRTAPQDELTKEETTAIKQLKLYCNEARLYVRGYEYAETRAEQQKAARAAHKNLTKLEKESLQLSRIFGPADTAELGAFIDSLRSQLT